MSKYLHRTSRSGSASPSTSEIDVGEITINAGTLGTAGAGFNNGRLYIKLDNGEIKRFIGLGLPGTTDSALKTKYGGTNNAFASVTAASNVLGKSLMYFNHSGAGDHTLEKSANDTLTWDPANNRLKVGPISSLPPQATLDVNGNVRIQTVSTFTSVFSSAFSILGWGSNDYNLYAIPSNTFLSYIPDTSLPQTKISGVVPVSKGGTGTNIGSDIPVPINGSVFYYNTTTSRFDADNDFRWDSSANRLYISGSIEFAAPTDSTVNAIPLGVDGANRLVKLTAGNTFNAAFQRVLVGSTTITANTNDGALTLQAGAGISITPNSATDTVIIANTAASIGGSLPEVNAVGISSDITLTYIDDKYQFLTPDASYNIILDPVGASEGQEFFIRNMDYTNGYQLTVYNSGVAVPNMLAVIYRDTSAWSTNKESFGAFVFNGTAWRLGFLGK
jgi:hypothetical protein